MTVTPDYAFRVGDRLWDEFKNGRSYYGFNGATVAVPRAESLRPNRELLAWHGSEVFKG